MSYKIYKGDDTDAFGNNFLTINLENPHNKKISKAEFKCGPIVKTFENPVFPLFVNLCYEETEKLWCKNCGKLVIYDEKGKKLTLNGEILIECMERVV